MIGQLGHNTRPHAQFPEQGCQDDLTTERSFDSQATWVIDVLGLFFDMLSMVVLKTRHWQMSGRLVQVKLRVISRKESLILTLRFH